MMLLDFETKSGRPIWHGHDNYFQDKDADILCLVYGHSDDEDPSEWWPGCGWLPHELFEYAEEGGLIGASNASFDQAAWEYLCTELYDFPTVNAEQWYCTQSQSRVAGLPSALDTSAAALGSVHRKSRRGAELIQIMCVPTFEHTPELLREMVDYCAQDWRVMKAVFNATPKLPQHLFSDYQVNEVINQRGVKIDRAMARAAHQYASQERSEIAEKLEYVTAGDVEKPTQHTRFKNWLKGLLEEDDCTDAIKLMVRMKKVKLKKGEKLAKGEKPKYEKRYSSDKIVRANMLTAQYELGLDDTIIVGLQLMDDAGGSATSKYAKMDSLACDGDDRIRGAIRFAGAPSTIRYSSLGIQFHNMIRDVFPIDEVMDFREQMLAGAELTDLEHGNPVRVMETLGKMLRAAIIPEEGSVLVVGDWSAVESRMTAWVCGDTAKLARFRRGECPYCYAAEGVYGRTITAENDPKERQIGKVMDLACGFLGGPGALKAMASSYGVYIPEADRKGHVDAWRARHPKVVKYGQLLFNTALRAMRSVGEWCTAGKVAYLFDGSALYCKLPDGLTLLRYPDARIEMVPAPWDEEQMIPNITALKAAFTKGQDEEEWPRHALWRGLLLENVVQASCAILLRAVVDTFKGLCIFHVHDEVILEVPTEQAEAVKQQLQKEMEHALPWCKTLPLVAEPKVMTRYGK